jgi:hypothetical protein
LHKNGNRTETKREKFRGKIKNMADGLSMDMGRGTSMGSTGEPASTEKYTGRTKVCVSHFMTIFILLLCYYTSPSAPVGSGKSSMPSFLQYFTKLAFPFQYDFIYRVVKEILKHPASSDNLCLQFFQVS